MTDMHGGGVPPQDVSRAGERMWTVATWALPFAIQVVFGMLLVSIWLLGKAGFHNDIVSGPRSVLLLGTAMAVVIALVVATAVFTRASSTARGISLGTASSAAVVAIGAVVYARDRVTGSRRHRADRLRLHPSARGRPPGWAWHARRMSVGSPHGGHLHTGVDRRSGDRPPLTGQFGMWSGAVTDVARAARSRCFRKPVVA